MRSACALVRRLAVPLMLSGSAAFTAPEPTGKPPSARGVGLETAVSGLTHPWGVAWLPDGDLLITERGGALRWVHRGALHPEPVPGVPPVLAAGQGGLLDVSLHPRFPEKPWVYLSLSAGTPESNRTEIVRGTWAGGRLTDLRTLFRVPVDKPRNQHFGSRFLWLSDGTFLVSIGDGGNPPVEAAGKLAREHAQDLSSALGKVLRLDEDGNAPADNPFAEKEGALAAIWSYGHRNIQGLALDPSTGRLFASEHGARGGDELNLLEPGLNYGWPRVTFSREYWGPSISDQRTAPGMRDPLVVWTPSPAPSGLAFYRGQRYPGWDGSLFSGGLKSEDVRRVEIGPDGSAKAQESIRIGERVRDVRLGPDGYLYVLTDVGNRKGRLLRLVTGP